MLLKKSNGFLYYEQGEALPTPQISNPDVQIKVDQTLTDHNKYLNSLKAQISEHKKQKETLIREIQYLKSLKEKIAKDMLPKRNELLQEIQQLKNEKQSIQIQITQLKNKYHERINQLKTIYQKNKNHLVKKYTLSLNKLKASFKKNIHEINTIYQGQLSKKQHLIENEEQIISNTTERIRNRVNQEKTTLLQDYNLFIKKMYSYLAHSTFQKNLKILDPGAQPKIYKSQIKKAVNQ